MSIRQRLRGVFGTAMTWAIAWTISGMVLMGILFLVLPGLSWAGFWKTAQPFTILAGVSGFVSGTLFSVVLATIHRRRQLQDLSPWRMGLWGALAGLLIPAVLLGIGVTMGTALEWDVVFGTVVAIGGLGAATASGTVKLAQGGSAPSAIKSGED